MRCPWCKELDTRVVDSRDVNNSDATRRRRECTRCHRRFTTYERVEAAALIVVKKDGRREEFNPSKLRAKLRISLTKRPVSEEQVDALIARVETTLLALGTSEVSSRDVGEAVMAELLQLDPVAYIRFASVYLQFNDLDELHREVERLAQTIRS